jgi:hypothetical protein
MKKAVLIFSVAIVALLAVYSFSTIDKYPDYVSEDGVTMFKSHYIKTIDNNELNMQLEQNFLPLFDKVTSVDAQFSPESGYYYVVFGEKNNAKTIQSLKIEKEDVDNETYSYIDFTNIEVNDQTLYCRDRIAPACPSGCIYYTQDDWCLKICGPYVNHVCIPD